MHRGVAALVLPLLLATGCTSSAGPASPRLTASCPRASASGFHWPKQMPAGLPQPPGAQLIAVRQLPTGWRVVTFSSPGSVRENLLFAIAALQAAGYTVGRGAVGTSESRLPFTRSGRPGAIRLTASTECRTRWQIEA